MRETTSAPEGFEGPDTIRNGSRSPSSDGNQLVRTFLIADIRGYTVFTQERGDEAAARLVEDFSEIVRERLEAAEGSLIELRGDEALTVFDSPRRAVLAAVELQGRLLAYSRANPDRSLPVGIGIDSGEAVPVGDGYRGGALNLAARLCSEAGPGEILGSDTVVHLARTMEGIRYVDRGEILLKGLAEPTRVFAIASAGTNVTEQMAKLAPRPSTKSATGRLKFRILGPLEVGQGHRTLSLGGPKQRAVLAYLVVRANELVSAENLASALWGDEPPDSARNTLYTYVSHLRGVLGRDRIQSQTPGYRLVLGAGELDAARFEELLRDAGKSRAINPRSSAAVLEEALGLWRGPALADVAEDGSLLAEAARLDELRLVASEEHIDALLAIGEQARVIAEAEALVDLHPLGERIWQQLMLALYREGRQAEALNAYQRVREILADELGIDPSPDLARLHEQILQQDPALELRGEPLRGYRLLEKIDEGPTGVVFRAIQPHVGREVAVKIFHEELASDPSFVRRFDQEAQAAAALEHPHIVPIYDYWREPGRAYVVSRYLKGGSLAGRETRGEQLERDRALIVVEQIGSALAFAHGRQIAHGNVGPSNVLFDGEENAYLGDLHVGVGASPEVVNDIREFASLSQGLLGAGMPRPLDELVQRAALGTDVPSADELVSAVRVDLPSQTAAAPPEADLRNPYKGLRAFTEADASDYFGRSELTARLLARMGRSRKGSRFIAVVGPSGSGKSSVVRAGMVPAIRQGAVGDPERVFVAEMFPGTHPLDELEAALLRVSTNPASRLHDLLSEGSRGLLDAIDLVLPAPAELVLVVDQFEEVFTLATDELERELFLESLRVAVADPESRLRVIVTLRADFYDRPLVYPRFGELLAAGTEVVSPLTPDETEQAIRRPAEGVGLTADPGLVAEIVADVAHQPGALPLLQYALTELFERRDGDRITLAAYQEIGGVAGALSARADRILEATDRDAQRTVKQVFLRLVTLGEGREDTRRRVTRSELDALEVDKQVVDQVVDTFGRHRLLTFDREPATREPTVEIAHEALLGAWDRLRTWIDDARDDLRQERRLARAAGEWRGSDRDPSFLLRGVRLEQVESWATSTDLALGRPDHEYVKASLAERDRELRLEEARLERERRTERRSRSRLRALVAVLTVAALVAGTLTVVAANQRERAEVESREASTRELAAAAVANLEVDPQLSVLLAIEAVERTRSVDGSVLHEAEDALHRAVGASRVVRSIPGSGMSGIIDYGALGAIDWGPKGLVVVAGDFGAEGPRPVGIVDLRDQETGEIVRSLPGHAGRLTGAAFSADGSTLATTGDDGRLKIWDLSRGELIRTVSGPGIARFPSFSADGSRVAATIAPLSPGPDGVVRVLDLNSDKVLSFPVHSSTNGVAMSPDGTQVVAVSGYAGDDIRLFDVETGRVHSINEPTAQGLISVAWSPDGRHIAMGGFGTTVLVMDANGRLEVMLEGHSTSARWVDWSPDATRLLTGSADGTGKIWEIGDQGWREIQTLSASGGPITGVAYSPDGTHVMIRSEGRVVEVFDVGPTGDAEIANIPDATELVSFLVDGRHITTSGPDGSLTVLDMATGDQDHRPIGWFEPPRHPWSGYDFSPDGRSVEIHRLDGWAMTIRDVETGAELLMLGRPIQQEAFPFGFEWSPDGRFAATNLLTSVVIVDRTGRQVGTVEDDAAGFQIREGLAFGPHGLIAIPIWDQEQGERVEIWDFTRDEVIAELPVPQDFDVMQFDTDGSRIAIGTADTTIWDVRTERLLMTLPSNVDPAGDLAFSPDGSRLAEANLDGSVSVFDTSSGDEVLVLRGHDQARQVAFSRDGSMLATQGDGMVRIWALDIDDLLEIARQGVKRSLTDEECKRYLHVETCQN